jgi:phosphoglycerate-specific signal transduction histidine kinase
MEIYRELDELTASQMELVDDELVSLKIRIKKLVEGLDELRKDMKQEINKLRSDFQQKADSSKF